ncbi:hypothetical protein BKA70DRAFT_1443192 [Coprinopsis sp. MPI-PUGE-AT-0042]|nr:hypothetical protein BKA70DRAFT_1443192 [Coprinopsis sp. MPI-PUGE-AT-0042]
MALLKDSSLSTYQSVIYYISSRLRAILKYYTDHFDRILRDTLFDRFQLNLLGEYNFATGVVGTGVTRWGADFILPTVFKRCAVLLVDRQITDRHLAHLAASAQPDGPDALLLHYEGDWWTDFPLKDRKSPMTTHAFQDLWELQRPLLHVPRFEIAPSATFALDLVTTESLRRALATAEDLLRDIDGSIRRVSSRGHDIEARMAHVAGQRQQIANVYLTAYECSASLVQPHEDQRWSKFIMYSNFRIQTILAHFTEHTDDHELQHRATGLMFEAMVQTSSLLSALTSETNITGLRVIGQEILSRFGTMAAIKEDLRQNSTSILLHNMLHRNLPVFQGTQESLSFQWWSKRGSPCSSPTEFEIEVHRAWLIDAPHSVRSHPALSHRPIRLSQLLSDLGAALTELDMELTSSAQAVLALDSRLHRTEMRKRDVRRMLQDIKSLPH